MTATKPEKPPEFDVSEWRRLSMPRRLFLMAFCRHKHTTELAAIPHRHKGDEPESPCYFGHGLMTNQVIVKKCCQCGHFSTEYVYTTVDRSEGAFKQILERHWARL